MELNKILSNWRWGIAASFLNINFEKIRIALMRLMHSSIYIYCKGYFSTEVRLLRKYPNPQEGWYAFVGTPWPGKVYECDAAGTWVNTETSPAIGDEIFVELLKRYIDGTTIYWDEAKRVVHARGGGSADTFTITVNINAADIDKCTINATGAVVDITESADGRAYTILAGAAGMVKVQIVPESGYQVQSLTVDGSSKGEVCEYTFENLADNHTMAVMMKVSEEVPTEFLVRSDLPGMYYSSTQDVLNALKAAYPDGLTKDVTISCIKPAKETRAGNNWIASLSNWNERTMYTLTLDGANKLSYNGKSLGCLQFEHVDNVILQNIDFINFSNNYEQVSPDEMSAIMYLGDSNVQACNLYIDNCRFNGAVPTAEDTKAGYTIVTKNADNVYLVNSNLINCHGISLKMVDCKLLTLIKNHIVSDWSYIMGHPALCLMSNGHAIIAEDNNFTGSAGEYFFTLNNIEYISFRRNIFKDGGGEAINISARTPAKEIILESNLFANMLSSPSVGYAMHAVQFSCNVNKLTVLNNTAYMSGKAWQQWFLRGKNTHVGTMALYNNVIVTATESIMRSIEMGKIDSLNSGNNIYQVVLKNPSQAMERFFTAEGIDGGNSIVALQSQGYEIGSSLVGLEDKLLDMQKGGTSYGLTAAATALHPANDSHIPDADVEYKAKAVSGNTRGCYNLAGTAINEAIDPVGYKGMDFSEGKSFGNAARYTTNAESVLLLRSNILNRSRRVKMRVVGTQHQSLIVGKCGLFYPMPEIDENGEYMTDQLYTVNIE